MNPRCVSLFSASALAGRPSLTHDQLHVVELFFVDTFCQVLGALEQSITTLFLDDTGTS